MFSNMFSKTSAGSRKSAEKPKSSAVIDEGNLVFAPRASSHPPSVFNMPPKKVIKATRAYTAQLVQELSFVKGDFFYVIGEGQDRHFEVINPAARTRGLVPKFCFQSLDKANANAARPESQVTVDMTGEEPFYEDSDVYQVEIEKVNYSRKGSAQSTRSTVDHIEAIAVPNAEIKEDQQYWFSIEIRFTNQMTHILSRNYNDFWALQVSLLNFFPKESGRDKSPRIIPFMQLPTREWTSAIALQRRSHLDAYLQELIKLPTYILESQPLTRFFTLKQGDVETAMEVGFDSSGALMDLITEYNEAGEIPIKVKFNQDEQIFVVPDNVTYDELLGIIEQGLDAYVPGLSYTDESKQEITLQGDADLRLLMRTNTYHIVFTVFDPYN